MTVSSASFNERLARIEASKGRAKGAMVLHVGEEALRVRSLRSLRPRKSIAKRVAGLCSGPLRLVAALGLGATAFVVVTVIKTIFFSVPSAQEWSSQTDASYLLAVAAAVCMSMLVAQIFQLNSAQLGAVQVLGVIAAMLTLHNLAFWHPDLCKRLFSPEWVLLQQAVAQPDTLMYRGFVLPFAA